MGLPTSSYGQRVTTVHALARAHQADDVGVAVEVARALAQGVLLRPADLELDDDEAGGRVQHGEVEAVPAAAHLATDEAGAEPIDEDLLDRLLQLGLAGHVVRRLDEVQRGGVDGLARELGCALVAHAVVTSILATAAR